MLRNMQLHRNSACPLLFAVVLIASVISDAQIIVKIGVHGDNEILSFLSNLNSSEIVNRFGDKTSKAFNVSDFVLGPDPESAAQMLGYIEATRVNPPDLIIGAYSATVAIVASELSIPFYCTSPAHVDPELSDVAYLKSSTLLLLNTFTDDMVQTSQRLINSVIQRQSLVVLADNVGDKVSTLLNSVSNQSLLLVQLGNSTDSGFIRDSLFNLSLRVDLESAVFQTVFDQEKTLSLVLPEAASLSLMTNATFWVVSDIFPDSSLLLKYRQTGATIFSFTLATKRLVWGYSQLRQALAEDAVGHYLKTLDDTSSTGTFDLSIALDLLYNGVLGRIQFDSENRRNKQSQLNINMTSYRAKETTNFGQWKMTNPTKIRLNGNGLVRKLPALRALAFMKEPFIMSTATEYYGFSITVLNDISNDLFTYEVIEVENETQLMPLLRKGAGDLIVNPQRMPLSVVNLTYPPWPLMYTGTAALGRAEVAEQDFLSPLYPFSWNVWLTVILAFLILTVTLYCIDKISPNDYKRPKFSISESAFFVYSAFMMSKLRSNAVKPSSRIFILILWFASLMYCTTYGTNYFYMKIRSNTALPFDSLHGLYNQSSRYYRVMVANGSTLKYMMSQPADSHYRKLAAADVFVPDDAAAIAIVTNATKLGNRLPIYVGDKAIIKYYAARACDLKMAGKDELHQPLYQFMSASINRDLFHAISLKIQTLSDRGILNQYQDTFWSALKCSSNDKLININELNSVKIEDLAGIFIVLACALVFSFFVLLLEYAYHQAQLCLQRRNVDPRLSFMQPFRAEVVGVTPQGVHVRVSGMREFLPNHMLSPDPNKKLTAVDLQICNSQFIEVAFIGNDPKTGERLFKRTG